ncbi:MAG TPA: Nif11-like leader peptide family RiPP precursor [Longimicrobium sp.]|nr:Nif11-like leader peptide family RiPP precursor [Longimicrobium sp.]
MSDLTTQNVEEFLKRLSRDADFRHSLEQADDGDAKRRILQANGFGNLSREAIEAKIAQGGTELSDADLELVAGGTSASWVLVSLAAIALAVA